MNNSLKYLNMQCILEEIGIFFNCIRTGYELLSREQISYIYIYIVKETISYLYCAWSKNHY